MSYSKLLLPVFLLAVFISCQTTQKNLRANQRAKPPGDTISYATVSSQPGAKYVQLLITKDSIIYTENYQAEKMQASVREKIPENLWDSLWNAINLKDFDNIKSGRSNGFDGIDVFIDIEKGGERHLLVNGYQHLGNYMKIIPFVKILNAQIEKFNKQINFKLRSVKACCFFEATQKINER